MGTGHSIDTPIRIAHLGIDSVVSIVDDLLLERIRKNYSAMYDLEYVNIARNAVDGRARRIAAYLDMAHEIVSRKFQEIRNASFSESPEKNRYFAMLPSDHALRIKWESLSRLADPTQRIALEKELTEAMRPGSIDVNIMAKVDLPHENDLSDAVAALKGFAMSKVESAVVLSAGFNPRLYNALANFQDFYRTESGALKKRIILKVSDFRSAMIQGKFLAKKGLEVSEFRIESGLNCGGHAFYSDGWLLPTILREFNEKRDQLMVELQPMITSFYEKMGWTYVKPGDDVGEVTVQGGIGTLAETRRLATEYGIRRTGWGSPFLLVPEATSVDAATLDLLVNAGEDDLYLSKASPLGVPFNNLRHSGSEEWTNDRYAKGKPGSPCPKGFLKSNTEFTAEPICTASTEYIVQKLEQIEHSDASESAKAKLRADVLAKTCLCDHLGNGSLIELGIIKEAQGPQAICPGPNIAWFKGPYSLMEMTDHIYGRGESLTPANRPNMFAKELVMNVDYLERLLDDASLDDAKQRAYFESVMSHLQEGIEDCRRLATLESYPGENLASLAIAADEQAQRVEHLRERLDTVTA